MKVIFNYFIVLGSTYFQKLIDIPQELQEENGHSNGLVEEESEIEPELPSDSYFIMIFPEQARYCGTEEEGISENDSSREISSYESSI